MSGGRLTTTIHRRVYFADTDAGGVMHHTCHVRLFEQARTEWLHARGQALADWDRLGVAFVVAELHLRYHRPLRLDDEIAVSATLTGMRPTGATFAHAITRGTELCCASDAQLVCIKLASGKPARVPDALRDEFARAN